MKPSGGKLRLTLHSSQRYDFSTTITAEHAESAEIFPNKGHGPKEYFEYFIISSSSALSAVKRYFFIPF
jgi:hypothetical protein